MIDHAGNGRFARLQIKTILVALALSCIATAAIAQTVALKTTQIDEPAKAQNPVIVIVHSDDQVGAAGLAAIKSCAGEKVAYSEEKAIKGTHSVILVMHYDHTGKIIGVNYGMKDACQFVENAIEKNPTPTAIASR
jgi:hypothetical protein